MLRFNRKVSLTIITGSSSNAIVIDGLRVSFKVNKSRDKSPNDAKIEIYNLSEDTRNSIVASKSKVLLSAGYENDTADLFHGDIARVYTVKQPPNVITTIEALDGKTAFLSKVSIGYPPRTSGKTVLDDLARLVGVSVSKVSGVTDKAYLNGFSFSGNLRDAYDKVCKYLGAEWSLQNGSIKYMPKNGSDNGTVSVLSVGTGLLESPVKIGNIDPTSESKAIDGWKVKSLLLPKIEPGNKVVVESEALSSEVFSVATVEHAGDTHEDVWCSTLEVQEITGVKVKKPNKAVFA